MISVEEAVARIQAALEPLPIERIALGEALGRVLAEDLTAERMQPPLAVSAMDGYALRAADIAVVPATLVVIGESRAGQSFEGEVGTGQAVRIFTGAALPKGADTVIIQEVTKMANGSVIVNENARNRHFVRSAGLDFQKGDVLLKAGLRLTPRALGLAAAMNRAHLRVRRKPRIAVLSTGDELVEPGSALASTQNVNSNAYTLAALIQSLGGEATDLGIARDSRESLLTLVAKAKEADLLVTSGGASVGDHDLVRNALGEEGLELAFSGVAARPGKPTFFGHLKGTPMLGLPGNPVSVAVGGLIYLRPAIEALLGMHPAGAPRETARLAVALEANGPREAYLSATSEWAADGARLVTPFSEQDSSMLAQTVRADCLVIRRPHAASAEAGETIEILRFDGPGCG